MKSKRDEAVEKLNDLENILIRVETGGEITRRVIIALIRAVWWLMERYVREHDEGRIQK